MSNELTLTDEHCLKEYGWTKSQFEVIQRTYFKGLSLDEIKIFGHVCKHTGLDPFLKQIYPIMRKTKQKDGTLKETMTIQTAIDGYRLIAEKTGNYSPGRETTYTYNKDGYPISATAYIKKMTADGTWHEVSATAHSNEFNPGIGPFWQKMPHVMIGKCAEAFALRKSFPAQLSGLYTKEEMDQADYEKLPQAECEDVTNYETNVPDCNTNTPLSAPIVPLKETIELPKEPVVSNEQVYELSRKYVEIDSVCKENIDKWLSKIGCATWSDLPEKHYMGMIQGMNNNIQKNKNEVKCA